MVATQSSEWLETALREARRLGPEFGRSAEPGRGQRLLIEFVSANPTGPLTVAHGRGAALGDALANLLERTGYRVAREFYINDVGSPMERFARALEACYLHGPAGLAEEETAGVAEFAECIRAEKGAALETLPPEERRAALATLGRDLALRRQQATLARMGVRFDTWYAERTLHETGRIAEIIEWLRRNGYAYEAEGAVWLRSTAVGDEADRPLLRSNGQPTYIAGDLAYHMEKLRRGFQRLIDIWGPEHRDYVGRTLAGMRALGSDADVLEILVFGPVSLRVGGVLVEGGSQKASSLLLDDLLDAIGPDATRFHLLSRPVAAPIELDLDRARRRDDENPLHAVREALAETRAQRAGLGEAAPEVEPADLPHPAERELWRQVALFPEAIQRAAGERDPHRLVGYLLDLTAATRALRAAGDTGSARPARAALLEGVEVAFANALAVLGIELAEARA